MSIIAAALLAASPLAPAIDRASLDLQAQAESLRPSAAAARAERRRGPPLRLDDLATIASICGAASGQRNPGAFLGVLERAYGLSHADASALRSSCAGYLAASFRRTNLR